ETNESGQELTMMRDLQKDVYLRRLEDGDFEMMHLDYFHNGERNWNHTVLHYHRMVQRENKKSTFYQVVLSSHYNMTDYVQSCGCANSTVTLNSTSEFNFTSPRFPRHYCDDLICETTFVVPEGYRVVFRPRKLSLQQNRDHLSLFDLSSNGTRIPRERYTGFVLEGFTTESRGNKFLAVFTSDDAINYDGFQASVYAAPQDDSQFTDYDDIDNSNGDKKK
ncbi:hypothetical protein PFISCL1PPCAC_23405, partial [Pristionchus fissidentatus]